MSGIDKARSTLAVFLMVFVLVAGLITGGFASARASEDPVSVKELIAALETAKGDELWRVIDRLGSSGDSRAVEPLMAALEKDMKERRGFAMGIIPALGELGDDRALPLLLKALNNLDESWLGRTVAAQALGQIGSPRAVPALISASWRADTRQAAIFALGGMGDARSVEALLSALDRTEEPEVRQAAVEGLVTIGPGAVPGLAELLASGSKENPAPFQRALAARILGRIGGPEAEKALKASAADPVEEVRRAVVRALKQ